MIRSRGHLADRSDAPGSGEIAHELTRGDRLMIEHILSSSAPPTVEYLQDHDEWVLLLEGGATIEVDGETVELQPGDWLTLPADTPHRVMVTEQGTAWLAVHLYH